MKPPFFVNVDRSSAYSPMAIAGTGAFDLGVVMIPKGILAREKCDFAGIASQDAILLLCQSAMMRSRKNVQSEIDGGDNRY